MSTVLMLARRNLRLYLRDRTGVFFSLLGPVILLGLYALFLGRLQADALSASFPQADDDAVLAFVIAWVFAGVVMITTLTTGLSAVGAFVEDRASGRFADFLVSPITRGQLVIGYLVSSFVVAFVLSTVVIVLGQIVLLVLGGPFLGAVNLLLALGYTALSCAAFAALSGFAVAFLRSTAAFAALSTVIGTVLGFLAGAYIPPGVLPQSVLNVMNVLPFAQSAMLLRQPFVAVPVEELTGGSAPAVEQLELSYGMSLRVGETTIGNPLAIAELVALLVVFTALAAWRIRRALR